MIGTFAAVPYIHLQLETARRLYPEVPILIHDDSSAQSPSLRDLAAQYGAEFVSTPERQSHHLGDLLVYDAGLRWAHARGFELLLKISRRWIWRADWRPSLRQLAAESGADTYSHHTISYEFGFRTECVAFRVQRWMSDGFLEHLREQVACGRSVFVENYIHRWAIRFSEQGSPRWQAWLAAHPVLEERRGYAPWSFIGDCRDTPHFHRLWHDSDPPEKYAALAAEWGLPWTTADFEDPNQGEGTGEPVEDDFISGEGLPSLLKDLGPSLIGAEIGVARGNTSCHILSAPNVARLYGIDPFQAYEDWCGAVDQARLDAQREDVSRRLGHEPRFTLLSMTSERAAGELGQLDFVFIDGNHTYESVRRDLGLYWAKLRPGGLFSGHDYQALDEVKRAVDEFAREVRAAVQLARHDVWWWRKA